MESTVDDLDNAKDYCKYPGPFGFNKNNSEKGKKDDDKDQAGEHESLVAYLNDRE